MVLLSSPAARGGKLGDLREATGHPSASSDDDDDDDDGCGLFAALLFGCEDSVESNPGAPSPEGGAAGVPPLADPAVSRLRALGHPRYFLPYPYASGNPGYVVFPRFGAAMASGCGSEEPLCQHEPDVATCVDGVCYRAPVDAAPVSPRLRELRTVRAQLFVDGGADTDGLVRGTAGLAVDGLDFGFETRWTLWTEDLGDEAGDDLTLGDANVRVHLLSLPALNLSVGLGGRALVDSDGGTFGVGATAAAELYPVWPLVVRLEGDLGTLGKAPVFEAQGSLGVLWRRAELYAGYGHLEVASVRFESVFAGLRLHL